MVMSINFSCGYVANLAIDRILLIIKHCSIWHVPNCDCRPEAQECWPKLPFPSIQLLSRHPGLLWLSILCEGLLLLLPSDQLPQLGKHFLAVSRIDEFH